MSLNVLSENNESDPATSLSLKRPSKPFNDPHEERPKTTINTAKNLSFIPYPYCYLYFYRLFVDKSMLTFNFIYSI
jgi:hypothetical protein